MRAKRAIKIQIQFHLKNSSNRGIHKLKSEPSQFDEFIFKLQFHLKNSSNRGIHNLKSEPSQFDELFSNYNFTWNIRQIIFGGHFENTAFQSLIEQSIFYRKVCIFALFSISKKVGGSNCIPRKTEQTSSKLESLIRSDVVKLHPFNYSVCVL